MDPEVVGVVGMVSGLLGLGLAVWVHLCQQRLHRWQKSHEEPQVQIGRPWVHKYRRHPFDDEEEPIWELRVEIVNSGRYEIFIRGVRIEGAWQRPLAWNVEEKEADTHSGQPAHKRPLPSGDHRIYVLRWQKKMKSFVGDEEVDVVVYSHMGEVERRAIDPGDWRMKAEDRAAPSTSTMRFQQ